MDLAIRKQDGQLFPVREQDAEWLHKASNEEYFLGNVKRLKGRNAKFFRKWWAMVDFAYDHFEPEPIETKYGNPEKSKERFRKDLTVLAGHYDATYKINGDVVLEAKSIAWDKMDEDEFKLFYTATFNAITKHIFNNVDPEELVKIEKALWQF